MSGLVVGESPRWHEGRLWFAHWGAQEIVALATDGTAEVIAPGPKPVGFSLEWLADGALVVTGEHELLRWDGRWVRHTDLRGHGLAWNEIVRDGRNNLFVNDVGFAFGVEKFRPGGIAVVPPDGRVRRVAEDIWFPNGMVVTPDDSTLIVAESWANRLTAFDIAADGSLDNRRVWAEFGGDGICMDAEGAIWCASMTEAGTTCRRVAEGGKVLDEIPLDTACFACALGEDELYLMVAEWRGVENMGSLFTSRTGRVLAQPI